MAAGNYSFVIEQGTTFIRIFKYKDENGLAVDLNSYTVRMQIREDYDSVIIDTFDNGGNGGFSLTAAEGASEKNIITLTITATHTAAYTFDQALYDIELESGTGVVTRLLQGKIKLSREVTK